MFFLLDPTLLNYVFAAGLTAVATAAYWFSRKGAPTLGLEQTDLQNIAKGVMKGTLHVEDLDNIM